MSAFRMRTTDLSYGQSRLAANLGIRTDFHFEVLNLGETGSKFCDALRRSNDSADRQQFSLGFLSDAIDG